MVKSKLNTDILTGLREVERLGRLLTEDEAKAYKVN